ncbi:MAG: hypothetical protein IJP65_02370, partial [Bacteroidales bacterium]|nr:hypothetical protein [Bacteroidales bacterium]
ADASLSVELTGETNTGSCPIVVTRTYTIKDACNNPVTLTQTINVQDVIAPALSGTWLDDIINQNNCFANRDISGLLSDASAAALYSDNCGGTVTATHEDAVSGDDCLWTVTRTYTISDGCGNTTTNQMSVSGSDQTAPALTGTWPANITGQDNCFANADTTGLLNDSEIKALFSDCGSFTVTHTDAATLTDNCGWTWTRTYTIKDACNNTYYVSGTTLPTMSVSGSDQTAPDFVVPTDITVCRNTADTYADVILPSLTGEPTELSDNCTTGGALAQNIAHEDTPVSNADGTVTITRAWTLTDACGNFTTKNQIITVNPYVVMNQVVSQVICHNTAISPIDFTSTLTESRMSYTWEATNTSDNGGYIGGLPASGSNDISALTLTNNTTQSQMSTITVTPTYTYNNISCTNTTMTFTVTVNPQIRMDEVADQNICHGTQMTAVTFGSEITDGTVVYDWTRDNTTNVTGIANSGTGDIAATTLSNLTTTAQTVTFTVRPTYTNNGISCEGADSTFTVTVNPQVTLVVSPDATQNITFGDAINTLTITNTASDLTVSLTYNGASKDFADAGLTFDPDDKTVSGTPNAYGTYVITATANSLAAYNCGTEVRTVTINVAQRALTIKLDTTKVYDGLQFVSTYAATGAGYTVTGLQNGATITAGVVTSRAKDVATYTYTGTTAPTSGADMTITTAFTTSDGITNYNVTYNFKQVITLRPLNITADNLTKMYDGTEHTYAEGTAPFYTVEAESTDRGLLSGNTVTAITLAGARTNVGTENIVPSAATIMSGSDDVTANYAINYVNGTLTIIPRTGVMVTIQEHGAEYDYDGTLKTVTGYTFSSNDPLYLESYITFTGDATASGIGVENALRIFPMQLYASDFSNNNTNFSNVQFTIADSALYIYPMLKATAATTNITCNGFNNGEVQISVTGGKRNAGKYMFAIDGGTGTWETTPHTFTDLTPTAHTVVVTDSLGYTFELNFTTTEPDALSAVITNPSNTCPNQGSYAISVTVTGGTADYHYVWGGDATDVDAASTTAAQIGANDCGNTYSVNVTVTDHFNCIVTQTSSFEVKDIEAPTFTVPTDTTLCRETGGIINADIAITGDVTDEADNCATGIEAVWIDLDTTGNDSGNRVINRQWTLTDLCNNSTSHTQHITIRPSIYTPGNVEFTCPDTTVVLLYGRSDTLINLNHILTNNMTDMTLTVQNTNGPLDNRFSAELSPYTITWKVIDECGGFLEFTQVVTILYPPCGGTMTAIDGDGNVYGTVRAGSNCWTVPNMRTTHYTAAQGGGEVPYVQYPGTDLTTYGYLYDYYAATKLSRSLPTQVQGICPDGWHIPDDEDFADLMVHYDAPRLMTTDHWLNPGTNTSGFSAEPAGIYNPESGRFEYLYVTTYLWSYTPASSVFHACQFGSQCGTLEIEPSSGEFKYSVRCVRNEE